MDKLEKAGGFRGAILAADTAQKAGMSVWLGCMVSSQLACAASAQLGALATSCDLDGPFLVTEESSRFAGGYTLSLGEGTLSLSANAGVGVEALGRQ